MTSAHTAIGGPAGVATSNRFATDAACAILRQGGTAMDALIAAAAVQCVVENGSTTIAGMWISHYYDAARCVTDVVTSKIGPAQAETYDYEMEGPESYGGRGMPVPGWVAGAHRAWELAGRLQWADLFRTAIELAEHGYPLDPMTYLRIRSNPLPARTKEGRHIWMPDGHYLDVGEPVVQPALSRTLRAVAEGGPAAFYEGEFARNYVNVSRELGGHVALADMAAWRDRVTTKPAGLMGDYDGYQIVTEGALSVYALHLSRAARLQSLNDADGVYAQVRIMEEVLRATREYSDQTHDRFIDPEYARRQLPDLLSRPVTAVDLNNFHSNTNTLVIRDGDGNVAWLVHSVNAPTYGGAGILVDGAYAVRAINATHARSGNLLAPGLNTDIALFRDGAPYAVIGSPGFSCVHGPIAVAINLVQRKLDLATAVAAPRFALPSTTTSGRPAYEGHYSRTVFAMLEERGLPHFECAPSVLTGNISALVVEGHDRVLVTQDVRGAGTTAAFTP